MSRLKVLSSNDVDQFIEEGFTYLREGFTRSIAEPVLEQVWSGLSVEHGIERDDRSTWQREAVVVSDPPTGPAVSALYSERVRAAFDDLLGAGRWVERGERTGAWPITFPGFADKPWQPKAGWHIDGGGHRHVNCPNQALIAIMLFSDIGPGDGGTAIRVGSHKTSARVLQEAEPEGMSHSEFINLGTQAGHHLPFVEAQGQLGDVVLCHGYVSHSASHNTGMEPRIITNNCIALHEPTNLNRDDPSAYSPFERSIVEALKTVA